ncbi:DUF4113 domain-containing protein [Rheinheimera baltica]
MTEKGVTSQDTTQQWVMKHELLSPTYTTNWKEIPVAK